MYAILTLIYGLNVDDLTGCLCRRSIVGSLLDVPTHTVNMTTLKSTHDLWQSYSMSPYEVRKYYRAVSAQYPDTSRPQLRAH